MMLCNFNYTEYCYCFLTDFDSFTGHAGKFSYSAMLYWDQSVARIMFWQALNWLLGSYKYQNDAVWDTNCWPFAKYKKQDSADVSWSRNSVMAGIDWFRMLSNEGWPVVGSTQLGIICSCQLMFTSGFMCNTTLMEWLSTEKVKVDVIDIILMQLRSGRCRMRCTGSHIF